MSIKSALLDPMIESCIVNEYTLTGIYDQKKYKQRRLKIILLILTLIRFFSFGAIENDVTKILMGDFYWPLGKLLNSVIWLFFNLGLVKVLGFAMVFWAFEASGRMSFIHKLADVVEL